MGFRIGGTLGKLAKKARKGLGLPALTVGNVAKTAADFVPLPGVKQGVTSLVDTLSRPRGASQLGSMIAADIQGKAETAGNALSTYNQVRDVAGAPVPLWLVGGALALILLGRR